MAGRDFVFNIPNLQTRLTGYMHAAVEQGLEEMAADAKKHAPVRNVFKGGRRPSETAELRAERMDIARGHSLRRFHRSADQQQNFLNLVKRQTPKDRRYRLQTTDKFGAPTIAKSPREYGHSRSYDPIVRDLSEEIYRGAYGFPRRGISDSRSLRDVTGYKVKGNNVGLPRRLARGPRELGEVQQFGERQRPPSVIDFPIRDALNKQGLAELRRQAQIFNRAERNTPRSLSGLAGTGIASGPHSSLVNSAFFVHSSGRTTLGGRLREEIYATGVRDTGGTVSGWVVSPTSYAIYQEYGTSRHRAQPYMRPALYRMRQRFPKIVELWMKGHGR